MLPPFSPGSENRQARQKYQFACSSRLRYAIERLLARTFALVRGPSEQNARQRHRNFHLMKSERQ